MDWIMPPDIKRIYEAVLLYDAAIRIHARRDNTFLVSIKCPDKPSKYGKWRAGSFGTVMLYPEKSPCDNTYVAHYKNSIEMSTINTSPKLWNKYNK